MCRMTLHDEVGIIKRLPRHSTPRAHALLSRHPQRRCAPCDPRRAPPQPAKYFSIDRVFRNESLDATHLAEFHQVRTLTSHVGSEA